MPASTLAAACNVLLQGTAGCLALDKAVCACVQVDEFLPQHGQQIRDHLWLYSEVMIKSWPGCLCIALQLAHLCLFLTTRDVLQSPS